MSKALEGVRIPVEAVIFAQQKAWCYVLDPPRTFRRVAVDLSRPFHGGYFLVSGVRANEPVLVKGAGLLLARELGSTPSDQD